MRDEVIDLLDQLARAFEEADAHSVAAPQPQPCQSAGTRAISHPGSLSLVPKQPWTRITWRRLKKSDCQDDAMLAAKRE